MSWTKHPGRNLNDPTPNDSYLLMAAAAAAADRNLATAVRAKQLLGGSTMVLDNFRLPAPSLQQSFHSHRNRNTSYRSLRATGTTP